MLPMGFGDDMAALQRHRRERHLGHVQQRQRRPMRRRTQLAEVLRWAVSRGMTATFHWHNDRAVHHLLDVLERVNAETPVAKLRWSIAHLNDASPASLTRMKAMGVGWLMQNAFYFRGEAFLGQRGAEAARRVPPIVSALQHGRAGRRRHRRAPGDGAEPVRLAAMDARRQDRRRRRHARAGGTADAARGAAPLHAGQRLVQLRGRTSAARSRSGKLADLAVLSQRLPHRADRRDRRHRLAAHHGRRPHRLCRRAVRGIRGEAAALTLLRRPIVQRRRRRRAADHAGQARRRQRDRRQHHAGDADRALADVAPDLQCRAG